MPAQDAAEFFRALEGRIRSGATRAMERSLDAVQERAEGLSGGPESSASLAAAGHPYAKSAPNAAYAPEVVNVQSGDFVSAWEQEGPGGGSDTVTGRVLNTDPVAELLEAGTRTMVARPLAEAVVQEMRPEVEQILAEELEKALWF